MSGHPVDQAPTLRGQQRFWQVITELAKHGSFGLSAVVDQTNADRSTVSNYVHRLVRAGFLVVSQGRPGSANSYTLVRSSRYAPKVSADGTLIPPTKRESMWRTMRMLKTFSAQDLAVAASTEGAQLRLYDVKDYLKYLCRAGYVRMIRGETGPATYRLLPGKITGPLPPQVQRVRQVYDPNLGQVVWSAGDDK